MKISVGNSLRSEALAAVNFERERRIAAFDRFVYDGTLFDGDATARQSIDAIARGVRLGLPLPDGFAWRAFDNTDVAMNAGQLLGLEAAMLEAANRHRLRMHGIACSLKALIAQAGSIEQVTALAWPDDPC